MFDGRLDVAAPIGDEQLAALPARRGVALLVADGDRPVVLLPAADIRSRVKNRLRNPDLQERSKLPDLHNITRKILWRLSTSHFQTDLHYFELARAVWPREYVKLLAWKPAWFIHVDLGQAYPYFSRTRDVFAEAGRYLGPLPSAAAAEKFIESLQDAFDLCRHVNCLRQSPSGRRCSYGQMGRCLCPCDGTICAADYARVVAEAADFAAGRRDEHAHRLAEQMRQAASQQQYEKAGTLKSRIARLGQFESPAYAHVADAADFRFLLIQHGGPRQAKAFVADCGRIVEARPLDYPLQTPQLQTLLDAGKKGTDTLQTAQRVSPHFPSVSVPVSRPGAEPITDPAGMDLESRLRMGLVAHYLMGGNPKRHGLVIRWSPQLTADALAGQIASAAEALDLRLPKPRKKAKANQKTEDEQPKP